MQGLPPQYIATATCTATSQVTASIKGQPDLSIAPPAGFGGPGDIHSPEDLQAAAVASCFILSFRAIAAASKLDWETIDVSVEGTLDKVDRQVMFTEFKTTAALKLSEGGDHEKAKRMLEKAEQACFISNSLKSESTLEITIT